MFSVFGRRSASAVNGPFLGLHLKNTIHPSQLGSLTDALIQVDAEDRVMGPLPKLEGHLPQAVNSGIFHRAFSVFIFSEERRALLIQKRASTKIVFPREWANTCCSHPLYAPAEMENVDGNHIGIKRAAVKRLDAELGIRKSDPQVCSFKEKIVYGQLSPGGQFGESEVDYILLTEHSEKDSFRVNPEEVEEYAWIPSGPAGNRIQHLVEFLRNERVKGFPATPWFNLMVSDRNCLEKWWDAMIEDASGFLKQEARDSDPVRDFRNSS